MTEENNNPLKVHFIPGCFDSFEGTQEELDNLIAEINRMANSGDLSAMGEPIDLSELLGDLEDLEDEPSYDPSQDWSGTGRRLQ